MEMVNVVLAPFFHVRILFSWWHTIRSAAAQALFHQTLLLKSTISRHVPRYFDVATFFLFLPLLYWTAQFLHSNSICPNVGRLRCAFYCRLFISFTLWHYSIVLCCIFFLLSSSFCLLNSSRDPSQWTENIFRRMPFNRHVIIGSEFAPCQNKWLYCCLYTQFVYYYLDLRAYSMFTRFFNATYDAIIMGFN